MDNSFELASSRSSSSIRFLALHNGDENRCEMQSAAKPRRNLAGCRIVVKAATEDVLILSLFVSILLVVERNLADWIGI